MKGYVVFSSILATVLLSSCASSDLQNKKTVDAASTQIKIETYEQKVFFDFDKSNIKSTELMAIKNQIKFIEDKKCNVKITLNGYTDQIGTNEYNQKLSENRGISVLNYINSNLDKTKCQCEIKGSCDLDVKVIGFGKQNPISQTEYAKNRRVEAKIETK